MSVDVSLIRMAEIGGSPTDDSIINLNSTESGPSSSNQPPKEAALSTSNQQQKEGALKRHADAHNEESVKKKKKKKSAEELASSTKGRNVEVKKKLREQKKKERKQQTRTGGDFNKKLMETRDRLVARLVELGERDMCMSDKAEEKALKNEETLRNALKACEKALKSEGEGSFDEEEQIVFKSMSIHIPDWPCLDNHVQDFALERLYAPHHQDKGVSLKKDELIDIINKVKSRDSTTGLPSVKDNEAMDRLLAAVNWKIVDAVHQRRFEGLVKNLEEYPGVDPDMVVEPELNQEVGDGKDGLKEAVVRIINECGDAAGSDQGIDLIELNADDEDKEGDEDELDDNEEGEDEGEEEEKDEDLNFVRGFEKHSSQKEKETMEDRTEIGLAEDEEQSKQTENKTDKTIEDGPDSGYEKETMAMEGGTSTNSPTLERDERLKELEKVDDIDQTVRVQANSDKEGYEEGEEEEGEERGPGGNTVDVADSIIVLDDDDEGPEVKEMRKEEPVDGEVAILPPQPEKMNATDAWRAKVKHIQQWVNKLIPSKVKEFSATIEAEEEDEEEIQQIMPVETIDEDDDDIVCDLDDFEMDSVSHSGLQIRKQQKAQQAPKEEPVDDGVEVIEID